MGLLVYRMRAVLRRFRGASIGTGLRLGDQMGSPPCSRPSIEPSPRPALTFVAPRPEPGDRRRAAMSYGLGQKVKSGARWSMMNTVVIRIANFATGVLLARTVFGPEAFGLYAVSQVILAVLLSANELGVSLAIVRWEGDVRTSRPRFSLSRWLERHVLRRAIRYCSATG